jgi:hypothetical protein
MVAIGGRFGGVATMRRLSRSRDCDHRRNASEETARRSFTMLRRRVYAAIDHPGAVTYRRRSYPVNGLNPTGRLVSLLNRRSIGKWLRRGM